MPTKSNVHYYPMFHLLEGGTALLLLIIGVRVIYVYIDSRKKIPCKIASNVSEKKRRLTKFVFKVLKGYRRSQKTFLKNSAAFSPGKDSCAKDAGDPQLIIDKQESPVRKNNTINKPPQSQNNLCKVPSRRTPESHSPFTSPLESKRRCTISSTSLRNPNAPKKKNISLLSTHSQDSQMIKHSRKKPRQSESRPESAFFSPGPLHNPRDRLHTLDINTRKKSNQEEGSKKAPIERGLSEKETPYPQTGSRQEEKRAEKTAPGEKKEKDLWKVVYQAKQAEELLRSYSLHLEELRASLPLSLRVLFVFFFLICTLFLFKHVLFLVFNIAAYVFGRHARFVYKLFEDSADSLLICMNTTFVFFMLKGARFQSFPHALLTSLSCLYLLALSLFAPWALYAFFPSNQEGLPSYMHTFWLGIIFTCALMVLVGLVLLSIVFAGLRIGGVLVGSFLPAVHKRTFAIFRVTQDKPRDGGASHNRRASEEKPGGSRKSLNKYSKIHSELRSKIISSVERETPGDTARFNVMKAEGMAEGQEKDVSKKGEGEKTKETGDKRVVKQGEESRSRGGSDHPNYSEEKGTDAFMRKLAEAYERDLKKKEKGKKDLHFFLALIFWILFINCFTYALVSVQRLMFLRGCFRKTKDSSHGFFSFCDSLFHETIDKMRFKYRNVLLDLTKGICLYWYLRLIQIEVKRYSVARKKVIAHCKEIIRFQIPSI